MPTVQEVLVASLYRHLLSLSRSNSVCVPRLLLGPLSAVAKAAQKPPLSYPSEQRVHPSAFLCDAYVEALFYYTPLHAVVRDAVMRAHDGSSSIFVPPPLRSFVEDWSVCVDVPLYGGMPAYLANIDRQLELFVFDDALPSLEMCPTLHSAFPSPFVTSTPRLEATWSDGRLFWPGSLSNCVSVPPREFTARDVLRLLSLSAYNRVQGLWRSLLVHGSGVGFVLVYVVPVVLLVLVLISVVLWRFRVSTQYNRWFFLKRSRHHWQSFHTSSQPRYCSACSQLISGFWIFRNTGLVCRVCHRTSHLACLGRVEKMFCKCPMQKTPLEHLWVHGNLPADSLCGVCGIICASQFGLHGLRCLWCKRTLHESCLGRHNNIDNSWCDLGQFSTAVVPPGVVTVDLGKGTRGGVDEDRAITQSISQGLQELAEGMSKLNRLSSRLKNVMEPAVESLTPVPEEPQLRRRALQREKMSEIAQSCPSHAPIWRVLSKTQLDRLLPANCSPLLVFVNLSSGGQLGDELCKDLYAHLNPMQVVPLTPGAAQDALQWFCSVVDLRRGRVLVCGGDGSVGWAINSIMAHISAIGSDIRLPVGVLPLGTGNDLSRVLGWGPYFDGQVPRHLSQIMAARETLLDFWSVRCVDADRKAEVDLKQELCFKHPKPLPTDWVWQLMAGFGSSAPPLPPEGDHDGSIGMLNYMDLGICASISLKFHRLRMEHPELFRSRVGNQAIYGEMGFREYLTEDRIDLSQLRIWCDGVEIALPEPHIEGLIVVNIPSFSGGLNLWRPRSYRKHLFPDIRREKIPQTMSCSSLRPTDSTDSIRRPSESPKKPRKRRTTTAPTDSVNGVTCPRSLSEENRARLPFDMRPKPKKTKRSQSMHRSTTPNRHTGYGRENFVPQDIHDGVIEVVAIRSLIHLGQMQVGLADPIMICQGSSVVLKLPTVHRRAGFFSRSSDERNMMPIQIDGEAKLLSPGSTIYVNYKCSVPVLTRVSTEHPQAEADLPYRDALRRGTAEGIITHEQAERLFQLLPAKPTRRLC